MDIGDIHLYILWVPNTNWKNMINNAMTGRSLSVDSGTMTPHGVPNPPPSYVSSNNDEEPSMAPLEI
jgi:hypothetical protein